MLVPKYEPKPAAPTEVTMNSCAGLVGRSKDDKLTRYLLNRFKPNGRSSTVKVNPNGVSITGKLCVVDLRKLTGQVMYFPAEDIDVYRKAVLAQPEMKRKAFNLPIITFPDQQEWTIHGTEDVFVNKYMEIDPKKAAILKRRIRVLLNNYKLNVDVEYVDTGLMQLSCGPQRPHTLSINLNPLLIAPKDYDVLCTLHEIRHYWQYDQDEYYEHFLTYKKKKASYFKLEDDADEWAVKEYQKRKNVRNDALVHYTEKRMMGQKEWRGSKDRDQLFKLAP